MDGLFWMRADKNEYKVLYLMYFIVYSWINYYIYIGLK